MHPKYLICLPVLALFLLQAEFTFAEYRFNDGTAMEIQWHEQSGKIINDRVCFNYEDDQRKYQQCRKKARDYFREECRFYTLKFRKEKHKKRDNIYAEDKEKFCSAYESYDYQK